MDVIKAYKNGDVSIEIMCNCFYINDSTYKLETVNIRMGKRVIYLINDMI